MVIELPFTLLRKATVPLTAEDAYSKPWLVISTAMTPFWIAYYLERDEIMMVSLWASVPDVITAHKKPPHCQAPPTSPSIRYPCLPSTRNLPAAHRPCPHPLQWDVMLFGDMSIMIPLLIISFGGALAIARYAKVSSARATLLLFHKASIVK